MSKPGPKTLLTKELTAKIRKLILEGMSYVNIQETLEINASTWDNWYYDNYEDFRKFVNDIVHERRVKKAGSVIEATMASEDERLALDASKFTAETLGKADYSKKTETDITSGGKAITWNEQKTYLDNETFNKTDTSS